MLNMNISNKILEKYNNSPDKQKANIYLSGIYLLLSIQLEWANEVEDITRRYGVYAKEFKHNWNLAMKAMDMLERSMRGTIMEVSKPQLNEEFTQVHTILTKYIFNEPTEKLDYQNKNHNNEQENN